MSVFRILESAAYDLVEINEYLTENASEEMATKVERTLIGTFQKIGLSPGLGHRRSDLTRRALFFLTKSPYVIVYRKRSDHVEIGAVLHGARNIKKILRKRSF